MSDTTAPSAAKAKEQKQLKMLAVLGLVLVLVLVFFVLKPFGGDDTTSAPETPVTTVAPTEGAAIGGVPAPTETTTPAPPPARPARTPFDPPR